MQKKDFVCTRCGDCCKHYVLLSQKDIKRIEIAGFRQADFLEPSPFEKNKHCILLVEDSCFFLRSSGKNHHCLIYENRPDICRRYPFFGKKVEGCRPVLAIDSFKQPTR